MESTDGQIVSTSSPRVLRYCRYSSVMQQKTVGCEDSLLSEETEESELRDEESEDNEESELGDERSEDREETELSGL